MKLEQLLKDTAALQRRFDKSVDRSAYRIGTKLYANKKIIDLANAFIKVVEYNLTAPQIEQVVKLNKTFDYISCCATHDFCDANELMAEAFKTVVGTEIDLQNDVHLDLWNNAWNIAKQAEFNTNNLK